MAEVRDALATCPICKVTYRYVLADNAIADPERPCHRCDPQEESDGTPPPRPRRSDNLLDFPLFRNRGKA